MRIKNIFFVACGLLIFVPEIHSMLVKTKPMPNVFFKIQKRDNSRPFYIPVGRKSVWFNPDEFYTSKDLPKIYDDIKQLGEAKCFNTALAESNRLGRSYMFCDSDTCCGRAFLLGMQKNIQAAEKSHLIKKKFLESVEKRGRVAYLRNIAEMYECLVKYRVILHAFCSDTTWEKRFELHKMIRNINLCLFDQIRVILEDTFEQWKDNNFKMTSKVKQIGDIRDDINEWHQSEMEFCDQIADEKLKSLYEQALVKSSVTTYILNRIDEEYKLLHCDNKRTRE